MLSMQILPFSMNRNALVKKLDVDVANFMIKLNELIEASQ